MGGIKVLRRAHIKSPPVLRLTGSDRYYRWKRVTARCAVLSLMKCHPCGSGFQTQYHRCNMPLPHKKVNFIGKSITLFHKFPPRGHSYSYQTKAKEKEGGGLGNG
jgi:hypothetical protein